MKLQSISEDLGSRLAMLLKPIDKGLRENNMGLRRLMQQNSLSNDPQQIAEFIASHDPTSPRCTYTMWMIKNVLVGQMRLPEDADRLRNAITLFEKVRNTRLYKGEKDINKMTFRDLEAAVKDFQSQDQDDPATSLRSMRDKLMRDYVATLYEDSKYKLLAIKSTPDKLIEVATEDKRNWWPASAVQNPVDSLQAMPGTIPLSILSKGTHWCVSSPHQGQHYLSEGDMYLIFKDNAPYLLATNSFREFRNTDDIMISKASPALQHFFKKVLQQTTFSEKAMRNLKYLLNPAG